MFSKKITTWFSLTFIFCYQTSNSLGWCQPIGSWSLNYHWNWISNQFITHGKITSRPSKSSPKCMLIENDRKSWIYVRLFEAECCHHSWSSFILPFPKRMSEYKTYWFYSVLKADALSQCVMEKTLNSFMEMLDNDVFLARKLRQGINVLWYFELIDIWGLSLALSVAFKYIFCLQPVIGDKWESQINICSLMPTILLLIIFHIQEDFW